MSLKPGLTFNTCPHCFRPTFRMTKNGVTRCYECGKAWLQQQSDNAAWVSHRMKTLAARAEVERNDHLRLLYIRYRANWDRNLAMQHISDTEANKP